MSPSDAASRPTSVLFVCLGNICRSPMAEGVFRNITGTLPSDSQDPRASDQFTIDSAGTGAYHAQSPPDPRTLQVLKKHGITTYDHAARKLRAQDFVDFDYIFAMDADNLEDIQDAKARFQKSKIRGGDQDKPLAKVHLFGEFGGRSKNEEIDDPYYGGQNGFDLAFEQVSRFSKGFLEAFEKGEA